MNFGVLYGEREGSLFKELPALHDLVTDFFIGSLVLRTYHLPCFLIDLLLMEQFSSVGLGDPANDATGIAGSDRPVRNIFCDNTSGADHNVISDVDAWTHDGISAQPDIVPDGNFFSVFEPGIAGIRMDRMSGCIDRNIRSHLAVVTDFYFCDIQDRTVVIGIKIFPDFNMGAVIAVKRRIDPGIFGFP